MPAIRTSSAAAPPLSAEAGLGLVLALGLAVRVACPGLCRDEHVAAWATVFGAICLQAGPYVVLGAVLSALVQRLSPVRVRRAVPRAPVLAVPVAAIGAAAVPGCECGSVSFAAALMRRGLPVGPALAVMLSGPATNPVVLVATAAAFPGRPEVVLARFVASLSVAVAAGFALGGLAPPGRVQRGSEHRHRTSAMLLADLVRNLALLTVGAAAAATLTLVVPAALVARLGGHVVLGPALLALLAVLLGVCSAADAFLAASFVGASITAQLMFMVVGPVVDVKLVALQVGTFGARFAVRVAVTTLACAVSCTALWSAVLL